MSPIGIPNIEKLTKKKNIPRLLKATRHDDAAVSKAAADALLSFGSEIIPELVGHLHDVLEEEKESAAAILDRLNWRPTSAAEKVAYAIARQEWAELIAIGDPAIEPLSWRLNNPLSGLGLPATAGFAIKTIGGPNAFAVLSDGFRDGTMPGVVYAMLSLIEMGQPASTVAADVLLDPRASDDMKITASQMLGFIGASAIPEITRVIGHAEKTALVYALISLIGSGSPDARSTIKEQAPRLPMGAAEELFLMLGFQEEGDTGIRAAFLHPNPGIRINAAMCLGNRRDIKAVPHLALSLNDQNPTIVLATANALAKIGGKDAIEALQTHLQPFEATRVAVVQSLARLSESPAARKALAGLADDPFPSVRSIVAISLAGIGAKPTT